MLVIAFRSLKHFQNSQPYTKKVKVILRYKDVKEICIDLKKTSQITLQLDFQGYILCIILIICLFGIPLVTSVSHRHKNYVSI